MGNESIGGEVKDWLQIKWLAGNIRVGGQETVDWEG